MAATVPVARNPPGRVSGGAAGGQSNPAPAAGGSGARAWKRAFDVAAALAAVPAAVAVIGIAAAAIRFSSPGPVFFRQWREGYQGRWFAVWKLRTMHVDAGERLERHLAESAAARLEWERTCKLRRDPRVIAGAGSFLRRSSLDELPQLWNVLRGEMSLVGPRPLPRYHVERYGSEFRALRRSVRPGITGLWQVSARGAGDLRVQETLDRAYIEGWSLRLDANVLARTLAAVIGGRGAY
ncbi:MAG: sugar transferase [Bryobacteraceae bacterium]